MAYTVTRKQHISGDVRQVLLNITADSATSNVDSGLSFVEAFSVGAQSLTAAVHIYANVGAISTSIAGNLGISGCTSGDQFYVICYGR